MFQYIAAIFLIFSSYYLFNQKKYNNSPPTLPYSLPFVGHGLYFYADILGFIQNAYQKYGNIFKFKIFRKKFVVICDHNMKKEFFKATEDKMSLYDILESLYFAQAFTDDRTKFHDTIDIVRKSVVVRYDEFAPKIKAQAEKLVERLKNMEGKVDIVKEMSEYISSTSFSCFICTEMTDEFKYNLKKFAHLLNKIIVLTYIYPEWLINIIYGRELRGYRTNMVKMLDSEIETYRQDLSKNDSLLFRRGVDHGFTNSEIGNLVVCLLYVGTENTSLGLSSSLIELSRKPEYWERCSKEENVLKSNLLEGCVLESARKMSHILSLIRKPVDKDVTIGGYNVGDVDCVAMCGPMMMVHGDVKFKNADEYNPDRYETEGKSSYDVMTWGAGPHLCPGKKFAMYEIMMGISEITKNFEPFTVTDEEYDGLNYFSPAAFAVRQVVTNLKER